MYQGRPQSTNRAPIKFLHNLVWLSDLRQKGLGTAAIGKQAWITFVREHCLGAANRARRDPITPVLRRLCRAIPLFDFGVECYATVRSLCSWFSCRSALHHVFEGNDRINLVTPRCAPVPFENKFGSLTPPNRALYSGFDVP